MTGIKKPRSAARQGLPGFFYLSSGSVCIARRRNSSAYPRQSAEAVGMSAQETGVKAAFQAPPGAASVTTRNPSTASSEQGDHNPRKLRVERYEIQSLARMLIGSAGHQQGFPLRFPPYSQVPAHHRQRPGIRSSVERTRQRVLWRTGRVRLRVGLSCVYSEGAGTPANRD
jgi:hypothetical protein